MYQRWGRGREEQPSVGRRTGRAVPVRHIDTVPLSAQMERNGALEGREEGQPNQWNEQVRTAWRDIIDTVIVPALIARILAKQEKGREDVAA